MANTKKSSGNKKSGSITTIKKKISKECKTCHKKIRAGNTPSRCACEIKKDRWSVPKLGRDKKTRYVVVERNGKPAWVKHTEKSKKKK